MKLLIATSFRPFGFSKNNDSYQDIYLNSLMNLNCDLTICCVCQDCSNVCCTISSSDIKFTKSGNVDLNIL